MLKLRRKIVALIVCVAVGVLSCMPVVAQEKIIVSNSEKQAVIEECGLTHIVGKKAMSAGNMLIGTRAYSVCGGLSYHKMMSSGIGFVDLANGSRYITAGAAWQCKNCNLVIVTEGDYCYGSMSKIGKWATCPYDEKIASNGVYIDIPTNYGVCNSTSMSGYKFFLQ